MDRDKSDSLSLGIMSADGFLYSDIVTKDAYDSPYRVDAPAGETWINVYSVSSGGGNVMDMFLSNESSLSIPYGSECPQVRNFSLHTFLEGETVTVPVVLHKNYCLMTLRMVYDGELPMQVSILGDICGYDREGDPVSGGFLYEPEGEGGVFYAGIPRQKDSSLRLDISDEDEVLREFAIGEYIVESGYDWLSEDLEDIEIRIDYAKTNITVHVGDWSKYIEIETVI